MPVEFMWGFGFICAFYRCVVVAGVLLEVLAVSFSGAAFHFLTAFFIYGFRVAVIDLILFGLAGPIRVLG
jgi:hypothetical protein